MQKDKKQGMHWINKSIDQHDARGQAVLGMCYILGEGVQKDEKQGVFLLRKAADRGDFLGQCFLGMCYGDGIGGLSKDKEQEIYWLCKSAEQGNEMAILILACIEIDISENRN